MLGGTSYASHLFLQNSRLSSFNNIFFKEDMTVKNIDFKSSKKKSNRSLS